MQMRGNAARAIFPEFPQVIKLYTKETRDLPEEVLRRTREEKSWGLWSIQDQVSHVASLPYRWLLVRWGAILFGDALPRDKSLLERFDGRMIKDEYCPQIQDLIGVMRDSFALAWEVLGAETTESIRDERKISEHVPHGKIRPGTGENVREWRENVTLKVPPHRRVDRPRRRGAFSFQSGIHVPPHALGGVCASQNHTDAQKRGTSGTARPDSARGLLTCVKMGVIPI